MTATATIEQPVVEQTAQETQRETHRKVCAYLKGYLVGYSKRKGMNWKGDKTRTEEFALGFEASKRMSPDYITFAHIIYNWIRHDRPHLGTEERDQVFVDEFRKSQAPNKFLATLAEFGLDIKEVLS